MSSTWRVSSKLETLLEQWLSEFEKDQQTINVPIYPSIMWSLAGWAYKPDDPVATRIEIPPHYGAGFYNRDPFPEGAGLIPIKSDRFGLILFLPRPEDLASERRLIDFDGEEIIVR